MDFAGRVNNTPRNSRNGATAPSVRDSLLTLMSAGYTNSKEDDQMRGIRETKQALGLGTEWTVKKANSIKIIFRNRRTNETAVHYR